MFTSVGFIYTAGMKAKMYPYSANSSQFLIRSVIYLLAVVSATRTVIVYPDAWLELLLVMVPFAFVLSSEKLLDNQPKSVRLIYLLLQPAMVGLMFQFAQYADFLSLLLLPACYSAPRLFDRKTSILVIVILSISMAVFLWLAEGGINSILFSSIYLVAYLMVWSFSNLIMALEGARGNAERLSDELAQANTQLRDYSDKVFKNAVLEERAAVARELHDSVTQTLFSINLMISTLSLKHASESNELSNELDKIQTLSESAMKELRTIMRQLKPSEGSFRTFEVQFKQLIDNIKNQHNFSVLLVGAPADIPHYARNGVLKIIRESLINIVKHAQVTDAEVNIKAGPHQIEINIKDNGIGFDPTQAPEPGHFGLEGMRISSLEIGAELTVISVPNQGCQVTLVIPKTTTQEEEV